MPDNVASIAATLNPSPLNSYKSFHLLQHLQSGDLALEASGISSAKRCVQSMILLCTNGSVYYSKLIERCSTFHGALENGLVPHLRPWSAITMTTTMQLNALQIQLVYS